MSKLRLTLITQQHEDKEGVGYARSGKIVLYTEDEEGEMDEWVGIIDLKDLYEAMMWIMEEDDEHSA